MKKLSKYQKAINAERKKEMKKQITPKTKRAKPVKKMDFSATIMKRPKAVWDSIEKSPFGYMPILYIANPEKLKSFQGKNLKLTIEVVK